MPIKPENKALYPPDWDERSKAAKERAGWRCVHPGCTARQYDVGRWDGHAWKALRDNLPGTTYAQARQDAADLSFSLFGDGPGDFNIIVIVLTTAHLNHDPADCRPENLAPMCQRHHLAYDQDHHTESAYMTRMAARGNLELPL
jgi:hypothetical protein